MRWALVPLRLRSLVAAVLLSGSALSHAGSYDDFFRAIKQDNAGAISALLQRGFDPNTLNPAGEHGLTLAVRDASLKVVAVLLNGPKINVEARTAQDESALMLASLQGLTELCGQLIDKGADVNKPGWAPLHYAATNGHLAVMRLLLEHDAYIDAESPNGTTPLMMAAQYGTQAALVLLLEAGADPTLKNQQGLSAIHFAQRAGRPESVELIASFIRKLQPKAAW
jgi:ankyrin repeat protein